MNETTKTNGGAVAVADDGGNISAYLDAHAGGTTYTRFKFAKDHRYRRVSDDEEVPLGKEFVVIYDQIMVGWIKFLEKGTPPESRMGRLFGGFMPCPRQDLGDTDQSLWEMGLSGAPADPWLSQILLPLQAVAGGELHLFGTTSITGRNAVGRVIDECRKMQRHDPDNYPIIKLALGSFQHRDERVGRVVVPAFPRVGKAPISGVAAATTSLADDMDDGIPEQTSHRMKRTFPGANAGVALPQRRWLRRSHSEANRESACSVSSDLLACIRDDDDELYRTAIGFAGGGPCSGASMRQGNLPAGMDGQGCRQRGGDCIVGRRAPGMEQHRCPLQHHAHARH